MDTEKLAQNLRDSLHQLTQERDRVDHQIRTLEDLQRTLSGGAPVKRGRGRPRKDAQAPVATITTSSGRTRKKPHWSDDARKEAAERMRKYWADRRAGKAKS